MNIKLSKQETSIHQVFDALEKFFHEKKIDPLLDLFTTRTDLFIWGLDKPQPITSLSDLRATFEANMADALDPALYFRFLNRRINVTGPVAWVYSDGVIMSPDKSTPLPTDPIRRVTHILRKVDGQWKIVHVHLTQPQ